MVSILYVVYDLYVLSHFFKYFYRLFIGVSMSVSGGKEKYILLFCLLKN